MGCRPGPVEDVVGTVTANPLARDLNHVLARTGGEEFSVLLRSCPADQARTTAQRLIDAVPLAQSCSIGIACSRTAELPAGVVAHADGARYEAKAQGRARLGVGG